jgi:uncharacterized membrane protein
MASSRSTACWRHGRSDAGAPARYIGGVTDDAAREGIGNRLAPRRFLLFLALLPLAFWGHRAAFGPTHWADSAAMAFDAAALVFLLSLIPLVRSKAADMRAHSTANDANRGLVLVLTTLIAFAVLAAIAGEMEAARHGEPAAIAKLIGTLLLIWLFANSIYALHYAHIYYTQREGGDAGGLSFPETAMPDYRDFTYFAFTLGMTFQTSDVAITSRTIRYVALLHSFGAFVFNIGVIAFAINAVGGG